jgi:hypothetical protein
MREWRWVSVVPKVKAEPEMAEETDSKNYNYFSGQRGNSLLGSLMTLLVQMKQRRCSGWNFIIPESAWEHLCAVLQWPQWSIIRHCIQVTRFFGGQVGLGVCVFCNYLFTIFCFAKIYENLRAFDEIIPFLLLTAYLFFS